ncbi:MAG: UDP-N-acetylmuramoyl-tripeptide--D-alanyl-D-alanine ligase [Pyrinomonadaceae bacterium MAG19_C2-C3]|nr:UDP-N-acetylmuramoyl-tripeptide--D-alanyl-D-alanine ligase [Pyrinomonadaceae bacterium MAG19_C2-C3]
MKAREASEMMGVRHDFGAAGEAVADSQLTGFAIDSRSVREGELFFALSPEDYRRHSFTATNFSDAHEYIPQAFEREAAFAVARRERVEADATLHPYRERLFLVDDVIAALQDLARGVIERWRRPVVAITGSAGKTTTKDLTAHLLSANGMRVVSTQKNYNNELGVPLSILQMESDGRRSADFDVAVLEMGMSLPGEIKRLTDIATPDIAVELIVAPVHLEFFDSIEQIAAGKRALVEALKSDGIAILNADDARVLMMREVHAGRVVTFGMSHGCDVGASEIDASQLGSIGFRLHTPRGSALARLSLAGRHNLTNALAAAAIATQFDMTPEAIADAFSNAAPTQMRGEVVRFKIDARDETSGVFTVIDDSYNSNPRSLLAMTQMLSEMETTPHAGDDDDKRGRRIVVAGEMLELGRDAARMHYEAGEQIGRLGNVDMLLAVRGEAQHLVAGAQTETMNSETAQFFSEVEAVTSRLISEVRANDVVLIKGSRGVKLDVMVRRLRERFKVV